MTEPQRVDFEGAVHYVLGRLARELRPDRFFHSLYHTRDDVVPAVVRLAEMTGLNGDDQLLLVTAAYFHDVGYIERTNGHGHEEASVAIARDSLPRFGYSPDQIEQIAAIIMATRMPQNPHGLLEELMADGDLDSLGRDDFVATGNRLRDELAVDSRVFSDAEWYRYEIAMLQSHHYFTEAARALRNAGKARNLAHMLALLDGASEPESR